MLPCSAKLPIEQVDGGGDGSHDLGLEGNRPPVRAPILHTELAPVTSAQQTTHRKRTDREGAQRRVKRKAEARRQSKLTPCGREVTTCGSELTPCGSEVTVHAVL